MKTDEMIGKTMYNILFYGDSNTWGFDPGTALRYPYHLRWTTICAGILGSDFCCIPAGMNGRTTAFDHPVKGARNGLKGLDYELQTHKPLDLIAIMLGTNDLKYTDAKGCAEGLEQLISLVLTANERYRFSSPVFPALSAHGSEISTGEKRPVLLISPILLRAHVGEKENDIAESACLSELYEHIADRYHLHFLDASLYAGASDIDGVHLGIEGHKNLGRAIAEEIRRICRGSFRGHT